MCVKSARKVILLVMLGLLSLLVACESTDGNNGNGNTGTDTGSVGTDVYVDAIEIMLMESFPVQVTAVVTGNLADGCVVLDGVTAERVDDTFTLTAESHREGEMCTEALVPFEQRVSLDVLGLPAGTYQVVLGTVSTEFTLDMDNEV